MKNTLLALLSVILLFSCGKDTGQDDPKGEDQETTVGQISKDREVVGHNQIVSLKVDKPKWAGDVVTYKWVSIKPDGTKKETTNSLNEVIYNPAVPGEHKIEVYVSSKGKEGNSKTSFNVINSEYGVGIFGNSKKIIIDAMDYFNKTPSTLLTGFYWPFTSTQPNDYLQFTSANRNDNYIFQDDKLIAGTAELFNMPYSVGGTNLTNRSYYHFLEELDKMNKIMGTSQTPVIQWKSGITQAQITKYETQYNTKFDGYGWALSNRDITIITADWSTAKYEAKGYLNSMGNRSLYEIEFAIRKK